MTMHDPQSKRPETKCALTDLVAELHAAGTDSSNKDEILRSVLAGCGDCIKIIDMDGRLQFMSEGGKRVMEVEDFQSPQGLPCPIFGRDEATPMPTPRSGGEGGQSGQLWRR